MIGKMLRFYREVYRDNKFRVSNSRNQWKDYRLFLRNELLRTKEVRLIQKYANSDQPILFIVSVPRSGSTLLSQLICQHIDVGYIPNFVARYWSAPVVGLTRYQQEQLDLSLSSELGNTGGTHDPHEFGYFWQYWFHHTDTDELAQVTLNQLPWQEVKAELESIAGYWNKPLVLKSIVHTNFKIRELAERIPQAKFLYIKREPEYVLQSLIASRKKRYGSPDIWWSIRPQEIHQLKNLPLPEQVAAQAWLTAKGIEKGLSQLSYDRYQTLTYEELVEQPDRIISQISTFLNASRRNPSEAIPRLTSSNQRRMSDSEITSLLQAYEKVQSMYPREEINQ